MLHRTIRHLVIILLFVGIGCNHKPLNREPIVIIDNELTYMPAGQSYVPVKDGYWISKEGLTRLLEKLEDLQHQINSMPKANSDTFQQIVVAERGHAWANE